MYQDEVPEKILKDFNTFFTKKHLTHYKSDAGLC